MRNFYIFFKTTDIDDIKNIRYEIIFDQNEYNDLRKSQPGEISRNKLSLEFSSIYKKDTKYPSKVQAVNYFVALLNVEVNYRLE